jgi:protein-arginine kinase
MVKVSREERDRLTNMIRNLMNLGASEEHILRHLKIGRGYIFSLEKVIKDIIKQNKTDWRLN